MERKACSICGELKGVRGLPNHEKSCRKKADERKRNLAFVEQLEASSSRKRRRMYFCFAQFVACAEKIGEGLTPQPMDDDLSNEQALPGLFALLCDTVIETGLIPAFIGPSGTFPDVHTLATR